MFCHIHSQTGPNNDPNVSFVKIYIFLLVMVIYVSDVH